MVQSAIFFGHVKIQNILYIYRITVIKG